MGNCMATAFHACFPNSNNTIVPHSSTSSDISALYTLCEELGTGGYATVHRCTSVASGAEYACKSIAKSILCTEPDRDNIRREVSSMKKLSVPSEAAVATNVTCGSIIKLYDVVEDAHCVHLILELCRGGSLSDRMIRRENKRGIFTEAEAARIMKSLLEALQACHAHGIIHRDVKPGNILFLDESDDSAVRLADFRLSTAASSESGHDVTNRSWAGTPILMAPEMVKKRGAYGVEVDMWSAGVLLYLLLSGQNPYSGVNSDMGSIVNAILYRHISFSDKYWDSVSVSAKKLAQGLLCRDPKSRLTASEALQYPWIDQICRQVASELNYAHLTDT